MDAARERVDALKREAGAVGLPVSEGSERDFLRFLGDHPVERRPYLALLDNGNFRAVWKGPDGEQIGLQFRGGAEVQFVLFAKRTDPEIMVRSSGRDTLSGIDRQIAAHDLWRLTRS